MKKIEMRHLRTFIAVAEESSYRRAAPRLHVAQSAMTRTIQQLEYALGAQLFERNTRNVQLTTIGRFLLGRARDMESSLAEVVETIRKMQLGQKGELFVGFNDFTISEILPPIIQRFRSEHPEVMVNLVDEPSVRMSEMVRERSLDIAFLSGVAPHADLDRLLLRDEKFMVLLPRGHALEKKRKIHVRELRDEPFVLGTAGWSVFLQAVHDCCESVGFRPRVAQEVVHSNDIVNFVAAGTGVSIYVDRQWLHHRRDIAVRPLTGSRARFRSLAVWRRAAPSPALANLIGTMRDVLARAGR